MATLKEVQPQIEFGTAGWRAVIGEDFTFDNVKLVTQAIANYLIQALGTRHEARVVVGYDTRFLAEEFAKVSACVLAANGICVDLSKDFIPTPAFAYRIIREKALGGINFTASHNPPEYQGLKFSSPGGLPAAVGVTAKIEKNCQRLANRSHLIKEVPFIEAKKKKLVNFFEAEENYFKRIKQLVDFDLLKKRKLKIVLDLLYGTGKGYLDKLLRETEAKIYLLHGWRNVLFGGGTPEPNEKNLREAKKLVKEISADIGLATDGDADRFGIIDSDGSYLSPNQILGLIFYHLMETRKWKGIVVRSVMTTHFLDALAKKYGLPVKETRVGFKYIGEIMEKEPAILGGEESGGLSIYGHIPEKDGILACLLVSELRALNKNKFRSLQEILGYLYSQVGGFHTQRINFSSPLEKRESLEKKLTNLRKEIDGMKIKKVVTLDGYKFIFEDDSWLGLRFSGTEPVVRLYLEANQKNKLKFLRKLSEKIIYK